MKVCILSTMYLRRPGDPRGTMVREAVRNLRRREICVEVVSPRDANSTPFDVVDGVAVHRFAYFRPLRLQRVAYRAGVVTNLRLGWGARLQLPLFLMAFFVRALSVARRCDLIHAQWTEIGPVALLVGWVTKKPVCVTVRRANWRRPLDRWVNRAILSGADHVFFNSSYTRDESLRHVAPSSWTVNRNTVDLERFRSNVDQEVRQKLGIGTDDFLIFSLGLLIEKKGFAWLIDAYRILKLRHAGMRLVIGGDGPLEPELRARAHGLDVVFTGELDTDETPRYFAASDVFALASVVDSRGETETLGNVLLEAMASGRPIVATAVGGVSDAVTESEGIMVPQRDPEALAAAIERLYRDPVLRERMGRSARRRAETVFASDDATIEVYERLVAAHEREDPAVSETSR